MMQTALRARLLADAPVTALTATRIDWDQRPQGKPLPALTLTIADDPRDQHMAGNQDTRQTLVRIDCWGAKPGDAHNLAEAVIACLVPAATQDGVRFLRSFARIVTGGSEDTDTGTVFRQIVDLRVNHTIP